MLRRWARTGSRGARRVDARIVDSARQTDGAIALVGACRSPSSGVAVEAGCVAAFGSVPRRPADRCPRLHVVGFREVEDDAGPVRLGPLCPGAGGTRWP